jgi:hypothetical protein
MRMNSRFFVVLLGLIGVIGATFLTRGRAGDPALRAGGTAWAAGDEAEKPGGPPPLVVDQDAPLLLDEPTETEPPAPQPTPRAAAENAACFVCHANYQKEPLVGEHAAANVACVDCHGKSYAHRNDENNTTPPEIMYPADRIDPSCQKCHATHDAPARKVIALWLQRCPDQRDPEAIVCTDCHGTHRLKRRSVRWDKRTGKLLPEEKKVETGAEGRF